jgi:uncharacterized protein YegP (UPF0339 family)
MATATKKVPRPIARGAASLEFLVHQDNGGYYHWEIVDEQGESLAKSGRFASHDEAERAARCVQDGAGSARFELHLAEERQLVAV